MKTRITVVMGVCHDASALGIIGKYEHVGFRNPATAVYQLDVGGDLGVSVQMLADLTKHGFPFMADIRLADAFWGFVFTGHETSWMPLDPTRRPYAIVTEEGVSEEMSGKAVEHLRLRQQVCELFDGTVPKTLMMDSRIVNVCQCGVILLGRSTCNMCEKWEDIQIAGAEMVRLNDQIREAMDTYHREKAEEKAQVNSSGSTIDKADDNVAKSDPEMPY